MSIFVWIANIVGWPVIHIAISAVSLRLPGKCFVHDNWITAARRWERGGRVYKDWFSIRKWKQLLPDGAPWLGGFSKKRLDARDPQYLAQFLVETRRAEVAHWCMLACFPIFFLWNPPWACWVMCGYAVAANLPCIIAQRYNRIVIGRLARRRSESIEHP
jgi:glycosyl-4,4'-diaponeurosporenoate acyltransferase